MAFGSGETVSVGFLFFLDFLHFRCKKMQSIFALRIAMENVKLNFMQCDLYQH